MFRLATIRTQRRQDGGTSSSQAGMLSTAVLPALCQSRSSCTFATCRKLTAWGTSRRRCLLTGWTTRISIPQASTLYVSFFLGQFGCVVGVDEVRPFPGIRCCSSGRCLGSSAAFSEGGLSRICDRCLMETRKAEVKVREDRETRMSLWETCNEGL